MCPSLRRWVSSNATCKDKTPGSTSNLTTALLTGSFLNTVLKHGFIYLFIFAGFPEVICMTFNI